MRYWDHFKRAFIPIALILVGMAIFFTLSGTGSMMLSIIGAIVVGVILVLVMRYLNRVED